MSDQNSDEAPDDGVGEFVIPLVTPKGQKFLITGKMRTKLDPARREAIVNVLADSLVADYSRELLAKVSAARVEDEQRPVRRSGGRRKRSSSDREADS